MKSILLMTAMMLSGAALAMADKAEKAMPRHNVLLIMTDEQCADAMSCVGNKDLKTPNMDRLAEEGVRFEMGYTSQPLCIPYRSALQTGRWPHQTGVMVNNTHFLPADVPAGPMLGHLVRDQVLVVEEQDMVLHFEVRHAATEV